PRLPIIRKPLRLNAGRVRLKRNFGERLERPVMTNRFENGGNCFRLHQRGRAAAEENAAHFPARHQLRLMRDLPRQSFHVALLINRLVADMAVEIAIGAFGGAKRPMHVNAEAGIETGFDGLSCFYNCFHNSILYWIPAYAGMSEEISAHPRESGGPKT